MKHYWVYLWVLLVAPGWMSAPVWGASAPTNGVYREVYSNLDGSTVADLTNSAKFPNSPDLTGYLTNAFEAPTSFGDAYGQRCRAWIIPPTNGNYIFWIASDDASTLFLSSDEMPANRSSIAYVSGWTDVRAWGIEANQQSAPVTLAGGQRYYLEALMKEGSGGDNLAVRWQLPSGAIEEPIPASRLRPFTGAVTTAPTLIQQPTNTSVQEGSSVTFLVRVSNQDPLLYQWQRNNAPIAGATNYFYTLPTVATANSGEKYRCLLTNALGNAVTTNGTLTVVPDTTPPSLIAAVSTGDNSVRVTFSEPVLPSSATNKASYVITNQNGALVVSNAVLGTGASNIVLATATQDPNGIYTLTVNGVRDASSRTNLLAANAQVRFTNVVFTVGYIRRQLYFLLNSGTAVTDLTSSPKFPDSPDQVDYPTSMGWPIENIGDNYGGRMSGYLVPPVTGTYTFAVRSDDSSLLYLSADDQAANKLAIASEPGCCESFDAHTSGPISLVGGQHYYIEALMKEGGGGDYLYVGWKTPLDPVNWNVIPGANLGNSLYLTNSAITVLQQPTNTTTVEGQTATFYVVATGASDITTNLTYQWQLGGTNLPGANGWSYTTPVLREANTGDKYHALLSIPGKSVLSSNAVLTVLPDTLPPTLVRVYNVGTTNVNVIFSKPIDPATGTNRLNYSFTNGIAVSAGSLGLDNRTIVLTVSPLVIGTNYTVFVSNVRDQATHPNTIGAGSAFTFPTGDFAPCDIGGATPPGSLTVLGNGNNVAGGGSDIGGSSDQFQFSYQTRSGDFDLRVRVQGLSMTDLWAKAGLMARETLEANSRFAASFATPSAAGCFFTWRDTPGNSASTAGAFPVNYPMTWLRLQRAGNQFTGYASLDGATWVQLGTANLSVGAVYVGMAVTSRNPSVAAVGQFRDFGPVVGGMIGTVAFPSEPLGPCSRRTPFVISEIMFKPAARADGRNLEFVEIYNSNPYSEDLSGFRLSGDIDFTFPPQTLLQGGAFLVVAAAPSDIQSVYGIANVAGPYTNSLKKSGLIRLRGHLDGIVLEVPYDQVPPWPAGADGTGHSLVLARPSYGEADGRAWALSDVVGGSPGQAEAYRPSPLREVVLNEILTHTETAGTLDYIELYNHSNQTNDLSGCILTDDPATNKFIIPQGTLIQPRGFLAFDQNQLGFGLKAAGQTVYFWNSNATRVLDAVAFEAQADGVSYGRWPNGAAEWYPMAARTPGAANSTILIRDIVINEVMYKPFSGDDNDQYLELYNKGTNAVNLGSWKFTAGLNFTFPSNRVLAANAYLVVAANTNQIFAHYPNLSPANTLGNFGGKLPHGGGRIALAMPQILTGTNTQGGLATNTIFVVEDEVTYGTGGRWGQWAHGGGSSLELVNPNSNHRLAYNWADSDETTKAAWTNLEVAGVLDNGGNFGPGIDIVQLGLLDVGECLVDNVEVRPGTAGPNYVANPDFEGGANGLTNWFLLGDHCRSGLDNTGGYLGGQCLHLRASDGIFTGINSAQGSLTNLDLAAGQTVTLRLKGRWLRGQPQVLLRLHGNWLELTGTLPVPANLGTPGLPNSRAVTNVGPAIYEVKHAPAIPPADQPVVVTARFHDVNGVAPTLLYRVDTGVNPTPTYVSVTMADNGTGGDTIAGDGLYSATIPAQPTGTIVAFVIQAKDSFGATTIFPADLKDNAGIPREGVILFGDTVPMGTFGHHHVWLTQNWIDRWSNLGGLSNESHDGTFADGSGRIIYNWVGRHAGSPYHQYTGSPVTTVGGEHWTMPDDDVFLGTASFNKQHAPGNGPFDDNTLQREQTSWWMARQIGLPWTNRRFYALFVNGNRHGPLMEDSQVPGGDLLSEYFPDDNNGFLYKNNAWFECDTNTQSGGYLNFGNYNWSTLNKYTTTINGVANQHKLASYRWNYWIRQYPDSPNNFTNVFALVDAANVSTGDPAYYAGMERLVDTEEYMKLSAIEHATGDWDSYTTQNQWNMYSYKPLNGKWTLLKWDWNIELGSSGSWGPDGNNLFAINGGDPIMVAFQTYTPYRRAYLRALKDIADHAMNNSVVDPVLDAKYAAFAANNLGVTDPTTSGLKNWISIMHNSLLAALAGQGVANLTFSVDGPSKFSTATNLVAFTGVAPVEVKTILINGLAYPITWTTPSTWLAQVPLDVATNVLSFQGFGLSGVALAGMSQTVTVAYTNALPSPVGNVVINEIMYNPLVTNATYVELYNRSTNFYFDLSGWRLDGVDFNFPQGSYIVPGGFLVVVENPAVFAATYGSAVSVAGQFNGHLDKGGETLRLIQPGTGTNPEVLVDEVHYDQNLPWPTAANGGGASLQLMDPGQDNRRVCNWGVGTTNPPQPPPQWVYVTATGAASSSLLYIYMDSPGDVYLDDLKLVAGSVPEAGTSFVTNGTFESALSTSWTLSANLSASALSTSVKHGGNSSLHIVSSATGTTQGSSIWQNNLGLTNGNTYTLSCWYLQSTNGSHLTLRLSGSGILSTVSVAPTATATPVALFTPGASNAIQSNLPSFPLIWLNEVMPNNLTNLADTHGHYGPWVELFNAGSNAINLGGFYLTDTYTNLAAWAFPSNASLNAGQFLVVFADGATNETTLSEFHTSFALNPTTGSVALVQVISNAPRVLDYVPYNLVGPNRSYGSLPDGQPIHRQLFSFPTPRGTNNGLCPPVQVYINEWMADNTRTYADPADGKFQDWFELYNAGTADASLDGYTLTDDLTRPTQYAIPAGKVVPAGGFLLVWADGDTSQNSLGPDVHASFQLSKGGEAIGLFDPNGNVVDALTFGPQTSDVSQGRWPDGYPNLIFMTNATPRAHNQAPATNAPPVLGTIPDQTVDEGSLLTFTATATDPDQPQQTLSFSLAPGAPIGASVDPVTGVFAWAPLEIQGPSVYFITIQVADSGTPSLTANRTFKVTVNEVNTAPILTVPPAQTLFLPATLRVTNTATDADLPANSLTFGLVSAPTGIILDSTTGVLTWTPTQAQAPSTNTLVVRVFDNGAPSLSATNSFKVTVLNPAATIRVSLDAATNRLTLTWDAILGLTYRVEYASDLTAHAWTQLGGNLTATGPTLSVTDTPEAALHQRFYRVAVIQP